MGEALSQQDLEAAGCWGAEDRAPRRPEMTEFRRRLRYHQSHDQAEARIAAAIAAGGRLVTDEHAPSWWTLADGEGNQVDVATTMGRD